MLPETYLMSQIWYLVLGQAQVPLHHSIPHQDRFTMTPTCLTWFYSLPTSILFQEKENIIAKQKNIVEVHLLTIAETKTGRANAQRHQDSDKR